MHRVATLQEYYKRTCRKMPDDHFLPLITYTTTKPRMGDRPFGASVLVF
ncbi:hypothetical protein [Olivibacter sp. XZL3]|nr:hypothetical protein [Olivibacter sp. XZL3]